MDVSGSSASGGGPVIQDTWSGGANQQWKTADGAKIIQWPANGGSNQEWQPVGL
ncbi:hypothetical protein [Streptomyces sp. NPDC001286]